MLSVALQFSDCGITLKTIEREDRIEAGEGGCARLKGKGIQQLKQDRICAALAL